MTNEQAPFAHLLRMMGTFDLATGHADNINDLLDSLESELRDVLGHYREASKAQPKQEPIARIAGYKEGNCVIVPNDGATVLPRGLALYTAPPRRAWVGLTADEIDAAYFYWLAVEISATSRESYTGFARFVEAKLKEKNEQS